MLPKHRAFKDEAQAVSGEVYHKFGPSCQTLGQQTDREVRMTWGNRAEVTFSDTRKWPGNANCPEGFHTAMRAKPPGELAKEKSLQAECASRAVSGELTSSVAENSTTGGS